MEGGEHRFFAVELVEEFWIEPRRRVGGQSGGGNRAKGKGRGTNRCVSTRR